MHLHNDILQAKNTFRQRRLWVDAQMVDVPLRDTLLDAEILGFLHHVKYLLG